MNRKITIELQSRMKREGDENWPVYRVEQISCPKKGAGGIDLSGPGGAEHGVAITIFEDKKNVCGLQQIARINMAGHRDDVLALADAIRDIAHQIPAWQEI